MRASSVLLRGFGCLPARGGNPGYCRTAHDRSMDLQHPGTEKRLSRRPQTAENKGDLETFFVLPAV